VRVTKPPKIWYSLPDVSEGHVPDDEFRWARVSGRQEAERIARSNGLYPVLIGSAYGGRWMIYVRRTVDWKTGDPLPGARDREDVEITWLKVWRKLDDVSAFDAGVPTLGVYGRQGLPGFLKVGWAPGTLPFRRRHRDHSPRTTPRKQRPSRRLEVRQR
jgi:hypothetical protein